MNIWVALAVATAISLGPVRPILTTSTATNEARVRETIDALGAYSNKESRVGLRRKNGALSATLRRSEAATIVERVVTSASIKAWTKKSLVGGAVVFVWPSSNVLKATMSRYLKEKADTAVSQFATRMVTKKAIMSRSSPVGKVVIAAAAIAQ